MYFSKYSCQLGNINIIYKFSELFFSRENTAAPKHYFQLFVKAVSVRYVQYSCKVESIYKI